MAISKLDRAKQFLPFDALSGFREALREKEIEYEEKIELTEQTITDNKIIIAATGTILCDHKRKNE